MSNSTPLILLKSGTGGGIRLVLLLLLLLLLLQRAARPAPLIQLLEDVCTNGCRIKREHLAATAVCMPVLDDEGGLVSGVAQRRRKRKARQMGASI